MNINIKEIINEAESIANAKSLDIVDVLAAIEFALSSAIRKQMDDNRKVKVHINKKSEKINIERIFDIVDDEELIDEDYQMTVADAKELGLSLKIGDTYSSPMVYDDLLGRVTSQITKQVFQQKLREMEINSNIEFYQDKVGQIVYGTVSRVAKNGNISVELHKGVSAVIDKKDLIPTEHYKSGKKIKALLKEIRKNGNVSTIHLSRSSNDMLRALFSLEIAEIAEGIIEIVDIARDPGKRSKVSVYSKDKRIDAQGACIGVRAIRINHIMNELVGEKIDVVLYDTNLANYVVNAIAPFEALMIEIDEQSRSIKIVVKDENLKQVIGQGGQNIKLLTKLIGWKIDAVGESEVNKNDNEKILQYFVDNLNVTENVALFLIENGFSSLESIVFVDEDEFLAIGFEKESVESLKSAAIKALNDLESKIMKESNADKLQMLEIENLTAEMVLLLNDANIKNLDDLAGLDIDELNDILYLGEEEVAKNIIMQARMKLGWF